MVRWINHLKVTKPNPRAQRVLRIIACWMRRIAIRYGIQYISIFTFADGGCDITAKDADDNYVIEEYTTWKE